MSETAPEGETGTTEPAPESETPDAETTDADESKKMVEDEQTTRHVETETTSGEG